jgi:hypothetical protein
VWDVHVIGGLFGSLREDRYADFVKTGELDRFLNGQAGAFGQKVPDGAPGSTFPSAGGQSPGDALRGLFNGLGAGLGEVDHAGGTDPSSTDGDRTEIRTNRDGTIVTTTLHADGSWDADAFYRNGNYVSNHGDGHGGISVTSVTAGSHEGDCTVTTIESAPGMPERTTSIRYHGADRSPGEGGSEANSDLNPLSGIDPMSPPSTQQMLDQLEHPGKDRDELDPNSKMGGFQPTKEDVERLGLTVPALDTLDPNSGVDPLTSLNLDPSQLRTRSEKDDRVDPNTGEKPMPGG